MIRLIRRLSQFDIVFANPVLLNELLDRMSDVGINSNFEGSN